MDACTLPPAEQPVRAAESDALFATGLRDTERLDAQRVRLVFCGDDTLAERVQRLVDAENTCCSFFAFSVTRLQEPARAESGETSVALVIEVPPARVTVLEALVARAEQARQVTS